MGIRKNRQFVSARPPWFKAKLGRRLLWADIRLTEEDLALMVQLWAEPSTRSELLRQWEAFLAERGRIKTELSAWDWSRVDTWMLVEMVEAHAAIRVGIETFLPPAYAALPPRTRRSLYAHILILMGTVGAKAGAPVDPLSGALLAAWFYQAGQYAIVEIVRRGVKQVGFYTAMLLIANEVTRVIGDPSNAPAAQATEQALEALLKSTWRRAPLYPKVKVIDEETGQPDRQRTLEAIRDEKCQELVGQIYLTVVDRWGRLESLEILARSLNGELNVTPRAIQDDLIDQVRSRSRRKKVEGLLGEPPRDRDDVVPPQGRDEEPSSPDWEEPSSPDWEVRWNELTRRMKSDPRFQQLFLAAMADGATQKRATQKQIAARMGITDRTVRNLLDKFKNVLED